ncbi:DUF1203 domain-containing protein [Chryseobacterium sp. RP-3-3]|uniref:DUF1203 domain-containing protein n=1 Tax=Chryseobacterium antibioticum TaxID=2728847 RepID=A0A7Y0AQB4_9FLAO|nr:DUF1203 domain-containing protein [Chryseobacterium antibioticum]NML71450.1 DUF1203 domain-containing protein [Chryseobacterium antibioticum]
MNNFKFEALNYLDFEYLNNLSETELSENNVKKMRVDKFPGFPCRSTLEDAKIGEMIFLLNYDFHNVNSPYRANGPIFVRANQLTKTYENNEIPIMFNHRLISIRGYSKDAMMIFADVSEGEFLKKKLSQILENPKIEYIHLHNAKPGCFNCVVKRI